MTEEEALSLAQETAAKEGWPWQEPVVVQRYRTWLGLGSLRWHFMTNAKQRGGNVNIHIDDRTASVSSKGFAIR